MMDAADLPQDFQRRIKGFKAGSGTFRMNVALSELPKFTCLPEPGEHHQSGIILAPTLDYMDRAFIDAKQYGWSKEPTRTEERSGGHECVRTCRCRGAADH